MAKTNTKAKKKIQNQNRSDHDIILILYRLAQLNDMSLDEFVDAIHKEYFIDVSKLPKNAEGDTVYPDGKVGIDLDMSADEEMKIHSAARISGVSVNAFMEEALESQMKIYEKKLRVSSKSKPRSKKSKS